MLSDVSRVRCPTELRIPPGLTHVFIAHDARYPIPVTTFASCRASHRRSLVHAAAGSQTFWRATGAVSHPIFLQAFATRLYSQERFFASPRASHHGATSRRHSRFQHKSGLLRYGWNSHISLGTSSFGRALFGRRPKHTLSTFRRAAFRFARARLLDHPLSLMVNLRSVTCRFLLGNCGFADFQTLV